MTPPSVLPPYAELLGISLTPRDGAAPTLLLPFRVMLTAAVTPSFVKQMVRLGWAKPNNLVKVKKAAKAAK